MNYDYVDDGNFMLYAAKAYENPNCTDILEFNDDLNRIKYIKRLFNKHLEKNDLKERLIINHIVVLYNVFEINSCTMMLVYKLREYLPQLKPFLVMLNYWPEKIHGVGKDKETIIGSDVSLDQDIVARLRKI